MFASRNGSALRTPALGLSLFALSFSAFAGGNGGPTPPPAPSQTWKEVQVDLEAEKIDELANLVTTIQAANKEANGGKPARTFHAKGHVALKGSFRVFESVPEALRHGIFKTPGTYPAWVRYSNGNPAPASDRGKDVRGIAVKVLRQDSDASTVVDQDLGPTQDFLAINMPGLGARNLDQVVHLVRALQLPKWKIPLYLGRHIGVFESGRILKFLASKVKTPRSLVSQTYFSTCPIQFGPWAAQFSFRPQGLVAPSSQESRDPNRLRKDFLDRIGQGDVVYGFWANFFVDEDSTPIEDASRQWSDEKSRSVQLGELVLSQRDMNSAEAQAEELEGHHLAYTPWQAHIDHKPLGSIMRCRKKAYEESAKVRRQAAAETD